MSLAILSLSWGSLSELVWRQVCQVTPLIVLVSLVAPMVGRKEARLSYLLWLVVLLKCLTPPIVGAPFGIFTGTSAAGDVGTIAVPSDVGAFDIGGPTSRMRRNEDLNPRADGESPKPSSTADATLANRYSRGWRMGIVVVWATGAFVYLGYLFVCWLRVSRLIRRSMLADHDSDVSDMQRRVDAMGNALATQLRLKSQLNIVLVDAPFGPAAVGCLFPTIVLPKRLVCEADDIELRTILAHECVHVRRRDVWVAWLQVIAGCLWWFNPLVWWTNRQVSVWREFVCDEEVIAELLLRPKQYGQAILRVLATRLMPTSAHNVGISNTFGISARLARLMRKRSFRRTTPGWCWAIGFTLLVVLLPGARRQLTGQTPSDQEVNGVEEVTADGDHRAGRSGDEVELSGQLTDPTGAPVSDATVKISAMRNTEGGRHQTQVDKNGRYRFRISPPGDYHLTVESQRWQPIAYNAHETIAVSAQKNSIHNYTLKRACRLRVRTLDTKGTPVPNVQFQVAGRYALKWRSDESGWATIGGLPPSKTKYVIAATHKRFAPTRLEATLDDTEQLPMRSLALETGVRVRGTAICRDGLPPAGWPIVAIPTWWKQFGYLAGAKIAKDGSFELPLVGSGLHNVRINVPVSGSVDVKPVLSRVMLTDLPQPVAVELDYPSPSKLVFVAGAIHVERKLPGYGMLVTATSKTSDAKYYCSLRTDLGKRQTAADGDRDAPVMYAYHFRIGPLPPGEYALTTQTKAVGAEPLVITAPKADVLLKLRSK